MRVAIATVAVPFQRGGADILAEGLRAALIRAGHATEIIALPFRFYPEAQVRRAMDVWESEDFTSLNLTEPDLVLCTAFPAYYVRHPHKRTWLMHQFRPAYDLAGTAGAELSAGFRDELRERDIRHLRDCERRFTIARNVSCRMQDYCGLASEALYHPPADAELYYHAEAKPIIFAPGRIETLKRQELLLEAMVHVQSPVVVCFAGMGGQYGRLVQRVAELRLADRVRVLGHITSAELRAFYAHCLGVFFGPKDEDYGYITLEAMLAAKPVVTCADSGGPLEFVENAVTGCVVPPDPVAVAAAIDELYGDRRRAAAMGHAGRERYDALGLSWEGVVEKLLAP
jgi:glycosyltransferase involved in cell wall biosynthesis